jgi:hypothetical protein
MVGGHGRDGAVEDAPDGVGVAEVPQVVVAGGVAGALADRLAEACRAAERCACCCRSRPRA